MSFFYFRGKDRRPVETMERQVAQRRIIGQAAVNLPRLDNSEADRLVQHLFAEITQARRTEQVAWNRLSQYLGGSSLKNDRPRGGG